MGKRGSCRGGGGGGGTWKKISQISSSASISTRSVSPFCLGMMSVLMSKLLPSGDRLPPSSPIVSMFREVLLMHSLSNRSLRASQPPTQKEAESLHATITNSLRYCDLLYKYRSQREGGGGVESSEPPGSEFGNEKADHTEEKFYSHIGMSSAASQSTWDYPNSLSRHCNVNARFYSQGPFKTSIRLEQCRRIPSPMIHCHTS